MKRILTIGLLLGILCSGLAAQNPQGQTRLAKEERTRFVEDSLMSARLGVSIEKLRDSLHLMATKTYVVENYVTNTDSRLTDSRVPKGNAGGDLKGTYPNPTIKSSVALTGSPTAPTPATTTNNTRIATTAYVKSNLSNYVTTSDSRLTDSRTPTGTAGGDLTGTYPNPTIKSSVALTGSPTAPTPAVSTNSTRIATTAYVKSNLSNYVTTDDSRLTPATTSSDGLMSSDDKTKLDACARIYYIGKVEADGTLKRLGGFDSSMNIQVTRKSAGIYYITGLEKSPNIFFIANSWGQTVRVECTRNVSAGIAYVYTIYTYNNEYESSPFIFMIIGV